MKKAFYWTVALLSVIYSCTQKEMEIVTPEEPEAELIQLTVKASIGETDNTKTAIQSDGTSIYWTQGDAINLFYGELSAGQFTSSITTPSQSTDFSGTLSVATGTTEAGMTARRFWGVYPYNAANTCDGSGVTLTITSAQKGVPGTFADKLNPTVATSPGLDLTFYNVGSWFIFSVTQENVVSATLRGNNNEDIAGTIRVTMDSNSRPVATVQSGVKSITITPQTGVSFEVGELYYMVLIPQTLSGGYTLTLTKADGSSADCVFSNEAAFARSSYRRKRDADNGLAYTLSEPEAIDLGLPSGLKWASMNVGATKPEEYGDYFAWGETEPKTDYSWSTYKFELGTDKNGPFSKYVTESSYGTVDNKTVLDPEDDAAHVNWGGSWRMPTDAEWTELMTKCTWTWTTQNGVNGRLVTGPNGKSIFLPAARYRDGTNLCGADSGGYCWSSSLTTDYPNRAWFVNFSSGGVYRLNYGLYRYDGFSVRPVYGDIVPVSSISIPETATLLLGRSATLTATVLPADATYRNVSWTSSDESIATVDATGKVTAVATGKATITVYSADASKTATCEVTVVETEAVDLGLPSGLKWATMNVGASKPEEYGDYFAWGETEPYYSSQDPLTWKEGKSSGYDWPSYKWCNGSYNTLTKYNYDSSEGTVDNKTVLDLEDDAAHVNWGGSWRMPTDEEWTELRTNCTWTWTSQNGVNGILVTGPNGKSIFLPAAGYRFGTDLRFSGSRGIYWSSSLNSLGPGNALGVYFGSGDVGRGNFFRCDGQSVRPVTE